MKREVMIRSLFITGGGGYVGSRLLRKLDPGRYSKILCLTTRDATEASRAAGGAGIEFIQGELLDSQTYGPALAACDTVLHLAAATGKNKPADHFRVNTEGTRTLVEECRRSGVPRFLHISTIAVKFRDQARYYYAQSKKQAEEIVRRSGLRYTILRPTIVIGKNAPVLESLSRLARAPLIPVLGNGSARVQPIYVDDLIDCILGIVENDAFDNQTVDLGGPQILNMQDFLIRIRRALYGGKPRVIHLPAGMIVPLVAFFEKILPAMPVTAGQLASFTNDGTTEGNALLERFCAPGKDVDEALRLVTADA